MPTIRWPGLILLAALAAAGTSAGADLHHVQITAASPTEAVRWYERHLDCEPVAGQRDTAACKGIRLIFVSQPTMGSSQGTGVDRIAFSYPDVAAKMAELEAVGVRGSGVRLQRFDDGSTHRPMPGLNRHGFLFDPWGTRIELVEDTKRLGFHHLHLSASDPQSTLRWYQAAFGGKPEEFPGGVSSLRFGSGWLLASSHSAAQPAPTSSRAIAHIAFEMPSLDRSVERLRGAGVDMLGAPTVPANARSAAKRVFAAGPDNVTVAVVEPGFAGVEAAEATHDRAYDGDAAAESYTTPRTPWGEPDLQGIWTGNAAHGIPLERPAALAGVESLTPEQAAARRERGTLGSIWGYEREWRDTTLGYDKMTPSTQVAMIFDPPDGRLPPLTEEGERRAREARLERERRASQPPAGPEDLTPYVRCITKGVPGMMIPGIYNNGLQIVQGPGFVAIHKEMVHEARVIPTTPRERVGPNLRTWLGDPQGRWDGESLVVESNRFNGRSPFRGSSAEMTLTERFTRVGPSRLLYEFTVDDPAVWVRPWSARFAFDLDEDQYELVEYACHEGNYGMFNILSGARARDREAAEASR